MAIAQDITEGVEPIADAYGKEVVRRLKEELVEKGKEASGTLVNSLRSQVKTDGQKAVVEIFAEDYFRFVDQGRKPGKFPPPEAIKAWTRQKGISESAAFPIARKIAERGIPAINILNPTIDEVTTEFIPKYEKEMERILGAVLVNDVFNQTNTKGQMIPKSLRQT